MAPKWLDHWTTWAGRPFPWRDLDLDPNLIHGSFNPPASWTQTGSQSVQPFLLTYLDNYPLTYSAGPTRGPHFKWMRRLTSSLTMGSRMVVVATLLVNVVNVVPMRTRIRTRTVGGRSLNTDSELPSTLDSPDTCSAKLSSVSQQSLNGNTTTTTLHPFNGLFSTTTWVSRHQKGKPFWILMKQEMMGWQWHQHLLDSPETCSATLSSVSHQSLNGTTTTTLHPFNGLLSTTTWVSRRQKGKPLDTGARDDGVAVASAGPYANHLYLAPDR